MEKKTDGGRTRALSSRFLVIFVQYMGLISSIVQVKFTANPKEMFAPEQSEGNVRTRSKSGVARQLDGGSIKCGCEWKINLVSDLRLTVADRDAYI